MVDISWFGGTQLNSFDDRWCWGKSTADAAAAADLQLDMVFVPPVMLTSTCWGIVIWWYSINSTIMMWRNHDVQIMIHPCHSSIITAHVCQPIWAQEVPQRAWHRYTATRGCWTWPIWGTAEHWWCSATGVLPLPACQCRCCFTTRDWAPQNLWWLG